MNLALRADARLAKRQASLLGESYLQLTPGYRGATILREGRFVAADTDVSPVELMAEVKGIMNNINDITLSLKNVIAGRKWRAATCWYLGQHQSSCRADEPR